MASTTGNACRCDSLGTSEHMQDHVPKSHFAVVHLADCPIRHRADKFLTMESKSCPDLETDFAIINRHRLLQQGDVGAKQIRIKPFKCWRRCHLVEIENLVWHGTFPASSIDLQVLGRAIRRAVVPLECWLLEDHRVISVSYICD